MSRNRDIADILGKTEARVTTNAPLVDSATTVIIAGASGGGGGGAGVTSYTNLSDLPTSAPSNEGNLAYVEQNNKLYYSVGTGWFPVTPQNQPPSLSVTPEGIVSLSKTGSATEVRLTATDADSAAVLTFSFTKDTNFDGMATITQDSSVFQVTPKSEGNATTETGNVTFSVNDGATTVSNLVTFNLQYGTPITNYDSVSERNMGTAGLTYGYTAGLDPKQEFSTSLDGDYGSTYKGSTQQHLSAGGACGGGPGNYYMFIGGTNSDTQQNAGGSIGYSLGPLIFEQSDSDIELPSYTYNSGSGTHTTTSQYRGRLTNYYTSQMHGDTYATQVACNDSATVIVWSNKYADNGVSGAGAVEFVTRDKTKKITEANAITHRQLITSPVSISNGYFGTSLELSRDALTLAVGEPNRRGTGSWSGQYMGGVSFYKRDSANDFTWSNISNLEIDPGVWNGAKYNDGSTVVPLMDASNITGSQLGYNLAMNDAGTVAVSGAAYTYGKGSGSTYTLGAAFVMERTGDTWNLTQVLVPQDCHGVAGFNGVQWNADYGNGAYNYAWYYGGAVGMSPSGNTILVSAGRGQIGPDGNYGDDYGNLVVYTKDSDNAEYTAKNWRYGSGVNVYGFARHRALGYVSHGTHAFSSETRFYAGPHYQFNGVIEYDSA